MLKMGLVYVIRHKHFTEGLSIRRIARDLKISRNTVSDKTSTPTGRSRHMASLLIHSRSRTGESKDANEPK